MTTVAIRFAIVGCGTIAPMHAEAIGRAQGAELVAVTSRRPEAAQAFAASRGIAWEPDLISLLRRPDVDVVTICTPSGLHAQMAVAAMRAGKHVVVEKPLAITLEQADRAIEVSRQTGWQLAVISQLRFAPDVQEVKRAIDGGRLGRVLLADLSMKYFRSQAYYDSAGWRGTWAMDGGGALMNQGIHGIDLLIWLAGVPQSIFGCTRTLTRRIEVEDTAVAVAHLAGGGLATITATTSVAPGFPRRLAIHGERGSIVLEETRIVAWQIQGEPERALPAAPVLAASSVPTALGPDEFANQYQAIADSLREGRRPPVNAEEARRAVAVVIAIYQSSRTGRPVPTA
ncbi:MAG: Gfo/Idh/MocA family oxidoreductase [Armatimonadota bacterium]|nr:Gfo/Idh/MocA family oxidoreductase [Armatimonadota bacterium]